jgi:HD-like signal output (HDOD) protein
VEEALLAGLVSDIGVVPFLYFTENFPRDHWSAEEVTDIIPWIRGQVGALVLQRWDFPAELVQIPMASEDWLRDSGPELSLADIVILSKLHAYIGTPRFAELPAIDSIPARGKLRNGELSPEYSLKVLLDAKDKINQAIKTFGS